MRQRVIIAGVFTLLVVIVVTLLFWNSQPNNSETPLVTNTTENKPIGKILISPETLQEEAPDGSYSINASYPVITLTEDTENTIKTNEFIDSLLQTEIKSFLSQVPVDVYLEEKIASSYSMTYKESYADTNYLAIDFVISTYAAGAAHPYTYDKTLLYDIKNQKEISLAEVFADPGYLNQISEKARTELTRAAKETDYWDSSVGEWIEAGTLPKEENYQAFILTPGVMTVIFPPYQVDSYAAGSKRVDINLKSLTNLSPIGEYFASLKN